MNRLRLIGLGVVLVATPLAGAHLDGTKGYPKPYCEIGVDTLVHDYGPVASGELLSDFMDGNVQDCNADLVFGDFDAHSEFARGGAWMLVVSGDGNYGTLACFGEEGHHPSYGPFVVDDLVLLDTATMRIAVDTVSLIPTPPGQPDCGDLQTDVEATCVGSCSVTFPPGIDGAYSVFVTGTVGHVSTTL